MEAIESDLAALTPQIKGDDNHVSDIDHNCCIFERHLEKIQTTIKSVSERVGCKSRETDNGRDRKRLKEKLKEAMKTENSKLSVIGHEREAWMEYLFGICKPDGRNGKQGSRFVYGGRLKLFHFSRY
jgi:hypothetical protein